MAEWKRLEGYTGLMFREHPTRRHGPLPDRCFGYRMQVDGKRRFEIFGWASAGWTPKKALVAMEKLREAGKTGQGPASRKEMKEQAEAARVVREAAEAERQAREERENITFDRFFADTYMPQQKADGKSARSLAREDEFARLWIGPCFGGKPLRQIAPLDLERLKKNMTEAGRAARSISYCLATVRQVFNHARRLGLYDGESPTGKVKKPVEDNRRVRFLSREEADKLLVALAERSTDTHDMALVSLHCGLRAGEVFSLEWGDVDLDRGVLTIRGNSRRAGTKTKSGKTRAAIMTAAVKDMLASRKRGEHHEMVFPGRDGKKIVQISDTFNRTVKALGFNDGVEDDRQKVVFHSLRHTYASWLVESGVDLYTVKELMGHGVIAMTERYSHLSEDTLHRAVRTMEAALQAEPATPQVAEEKQVR